MNLTTIPKLVQKHDGLTEGAVRWHIFNMENNGLRDTGAVVRKGRRVYLIEEKYLDWICHTSNSSDSRIS